MPPSPSLSIVIPLYNEAGTVALVAERLRQILEHEIQLTYELIFVDDGSEDNTWEVLQELCEQFPIRALRFSRNFGKEAALCAGIEFADGDAVITMDGDLQHPPELLTEMVGRWRETQCDLVEAVKIRATAETRLSKFRALLFYRTFSLLCGFNIEGFTDYKLLSRRARQSWLEMPERTLFFRGMTKWLGFPRETVEFQVPNIESRRSRWTTWALFRYALQSITAFTSAPLYFLFAAGVLFLVAGFGLATVTLYQKFTGQAVEGFTTVIVLVLFSGGLNFMGLAVMGLYLARIYEEVKARPRYVLREQVSSRSLAT